MEDPRCCGTGTCIINDDGQCWCGQTWDGERMCFAQAAPAPAQAPAPATSPSPAPGDEAPT